MREFPPAQLLKSTIDEINRFIQVSLTQPQSQISHDWVKNQLYDVYIMRREQKGNASDTAVKDLVVSIAKTRITTLLRDFDRHKKDSAAIARPYFDHNSDHSNATYSNVLPRGVWQNRSRQEISHMRESVNLE